MGPLLAPSVVRLRLSCWPFSWRIWPLRVLASSRPCLWTFFGFRLGLTGSENFLRLGQSDRFHSRAEFHLTGESETESEAGQLLVLQPIHDREQNFLCRSAGCFRRRHEMRSHVVGEFDMDRCESRARSKTRSCGAVKVAGALSRMRLKDSVAALQQSLAAGLFLLDLSLSRLGVGVDWNDTARMVDGAVRVCADGACTSCAFAVDDDCGFGRFARRDFGVIFAFILRAVKVGVFVASQSVPGCRSFGFRYAVSI